jgi:RNA polymerase sigma factor (sigma-70 family)
MMRADRRGTVEAFEGLVRSTARMYFEGLQMDEDDVQQFLRVKVWKGIESYTASRATQSVEGYVFTCVRNGVKDLLKQADRAKRNRPECFLEDQYASDVGRERFHARHLAHDEDGIREAHIERTFQLPSTLNFMERVVTAMLYEGMNQTEIAQMLGCTRTRVRNTHSSVQRKMMDWAPGDAQETSAETAAAAA